MGRGKLLQDRHNTEHIRAIYPEFASLIVVHFAQLEEAALVTLTLGSISAQAGAYIQHIGSPLPREMFHVGAL